MKIALLNSFLSFKNKILVHFFTQKAIEREIFCFEQLFRTYLSRQKSADFSLVKIKKIVVAANKNRFHKEAYNVLLQQMYHKNFSLNTSH